MQVEEHRYARTEFGGNVGDDTTLRDDDGAKKLVQPIEEQETRVRKALDALTGKGSTYSSSFLMANCK